MIFMSLYEKLTEYCASDVYPFHMPGHKRRACSMQDPFSFDITEIDGFDNLHHAEGVLKEARERAADLYHSSETHFLVNGSTAGILSAILACVPVGGLLLMARNSHRSAYNAVSLRDIRTEYLYPAEGHIPPDTASCHSYTESYMDINGPIDPADVEKALSVPGRELPSAVFLTSPTYDGIVSDVKAIADIVHRYRIPLIVDEAHGAHFGMHPAFPESSVALGADIVIHSLHKTLPSLTQTALLHVNGDLTDRRKLRAMLSVFQTSSPSYVLMASIDSCIRQLAEHGDELFDHYIRILCHFREQAQFEQIEILQTDDPSRILLRPRNISARKLYELLRDRYHLQPEMLAPSYVLMLTSVCDSEEGFDRLLQALKEINELPPQECPDLCRDHLEDSGDNRKVLADACEVPGDAAAAPADRPVVRLSVYHALNSPQCKVDIHEAAGHISAEYLYLYPPGVPLVAPGEEITPGLIRLAERLTEDGYELQGTEDYTLSSIWIIKEDT